MQSAFRSGHNAARLLRFRSPPAQSRFAAGPLSQQGRLQRASLPAGSKRKRTYHPANLELASKRVDPSSGRRILDTCNRISCWRSSPLALKESTLKRLLASLLLLGALIGLFGAQAAYAHGPVTAKADTAMAMDADCMAMMAKQQPAPAKKPCKGLTLDCIAAMGCVVPLVVADLATGIATPRIFGAPGFWPTNTVLTGKSFAPDPDPPMDLG